LPPRYRRAPVPADDGRAGVGPFSEWNSPLMIAP